MTERSESEIAIPTHEDDGNNAELEESLIEMIQERQMLEGGGGSMIFDNGRAVQSELI